MPSNTSPLIALVGFKRTKIAMVGGVRILVVRAGTVRILGTKGRVELDVTVPDLAARLTRTRTVELRSAAGSAYVYGVPDATRIRKELQELATHELNTAAADAQDDIEVLGPVPTGFTPLIPIKALTGQVRLSRTLTDALHRRGVAHG
ncbi:hypothetical protein EV191_12810 [Tamaricihabitans halophyticus]|uniref:Uncharacterized protein n=1 Tax=Tamaricihabitans halophyticus TaxID=1262583 RepID=A0A4R2PXD1_9PSEU|nr:hypothetical protein [Tamaricihabitans halophyticus]TCP40760.1 hypothetical protein EV191_12810 [Tamaricihabitans halophyticus]